MGRGNTVYLKKVFFDLDSGQRGTGLLIGRIAPEHGIICVKGRCDATGFLWGFCQRKTRAVLRPFFREPVKHGRQQSLRAQVPQQRLGWAAFSQDVWDFPRRAKDRHNVEPVFENRGVQRTGVTRETASCVLMRHCVTVGGLI
jgi:hypothetical protein